MSLHHLRKGDKFYQHHTKIHILKGKITSQTGEFAEALCGKALWDKEHVTFKVTSNVLGKEMCKKCKQISERNK